MPIWIENFLNNSQVLLYPTILLLLLAAGLSLPISADLVLLTCGYLSFIGKANSIILIPIAITGILIGDTLMFFIGKKYGMKLTQIWPFKKVLTLERIEKVKMKFNIYGYRIVFCARFMPGIRTVFMFSAGLMHLNYLKFILYDAAGAVIVVPLIIYSVIAVAGNTALIKEYLKQGQWVVLVIAVVVVVYILFKNKKRKTV